MVKKHSDKEIEKFELELKQLSVIPELRRIKDSIAAMPAEPEQLVFGFLPTKLTRVSPFFPMSKRQMGNRPVEKISWDNSWGRLTVTGERLSIYDENVLLAVLVLMKQKGGATFHTTRYQLCKIMGVKPDRDTYNALWQSLKRLTHTGVDLESWKPGTGRKQLEPEMTATILVGGALHKPKRKEPKFIITVNPYFMIMFGDGFLTSINLKFRSGLKGDITKSLYRFYIGQRGQSFQCHLLTLCKTVNLNLDSPTSELRKSVRKGLAELRRKGFLKYWRLSKSDIVTVQKAIL